MHATNLPATPVDINPALVRRLVAAQFPQWADLPITPVAVSGWDNRTFHLGAAMSVRLPSAADYAAQVTKEQRWLPQLAPHLPLPIPVPLGLGVPGAEYPWPWSIYQWLDGESALTARIADLRQFATALAHFLTALQRIDPHDGPPPGPHNFYRGGPLTVYDSETRHAIAVLAGQIDATAVTAVWDAALRAAWAGPPVWLHGDVAAGNLLINDGQLGAVIDFGCAGVGDPACDLTIAWTLLAGYSRALFRAGMPDNSAAWARGQGWALWKALITLVEYRHSNPVKAAAAAHILTEVLADH